MDRLTAKDARIENGSGGAYPPRLGSRSLSLAARLTLPLLLLVVVIMLVLALVLNTLTRERDADRLGRELEREARLIAAVVGSAFETGEASAAVERIVAQSAAALDARVTVVSGDGVAAASDAGEVVADGWQPRPAEIAATFDGEPEAVTRRTTVSGESLLSVVVGVPDAPGVTIGLAVPLSRVDQGPWREGFIAMLTATTLLLVATMLLVRRVTDPVIALRDQAVAIERGKPAVEVPSGAPGELRAIGRAIGALARRVEATTRENDRLQSRIDVTLAGLRDGVVITDGRGSVLRVNAAAGRMLGAPGAVGAGQPFVQLARDHELAALLREALTAPNGTLQLATVEHGRTHRILQASAQRLDAAGDRLGLVLLRDETELRRLERVRREFVANVSHELRTPLASIKALVETLEAGAIDDAAVAGDFLGRIVGEVDRLAALVDELLDLARIESGRVTLSLERLDPAGLIGGAIERARAQSERAGLTTMIDIAPDLPPVRADRSRVEQVLLNLIHNAIKFTPPGGTITIRAEPVGRSLRVDVADTGAGVPAAELPRLFERFYKADKARRSDGTGLGLAIAKHIVQAHGGEIWAESPPGEGATFSFTLPLAAAVEAGPRLAAAGPAVAAPAQDISRERE